MLRLGRRPDKPWVPAAENLAGGGYAFVLLLDRHGVVRYASSALLEALGTSAAEVVGQRFAEVVHPSDTSIARLMTQGEASTTARTVRFGRTAGWRRFVVTSIDTVDSDAVHCRIVRLEALEDTPANEPSAPDVSWEQRWRAVLDAASEAIIARDRRDVVIDWNRGAEKLYGYTANEMVGRALSELIQADQTESYRRIVERVRHGERVEGFVGMRIRKGGQPVCVSITLLAMRDARGRLVGFVSTSRETSNEETDRAKINALTRREYEVLKLLVLGKTNREIGELLGCTSLTARNHVDHVLRKLKVADRTQAAVWAVQHALVER